LDRPSIVGGAVKRRFPSLDAWTVHRRRGVSTSRQLPTAAASG
jgi:hypothetical protein